VAACSRSGRADRNGHHVAEAAETIVDAPEPSRQRREVATIDDLIAAGAQVKWLWPGWIPSGVLTAVAAPGGTGKTRFCADLLRRIRHQMTWPDGVPIGLPADAVALWVASDNHHDELVTLSQTFGIKDNIRVNAWRTDPYGGVTLETTDDLNDLDARMKMVRPTLVIVDTVGNATDKNLSRQEDAKKFYFPLQVLARRHATAILCLTHLNAGGQFLGRRVLEKVRVAIRIEKPDPESDRRRVEVHKSNSKLPPALGLSMGDGGNDYDSNPPAPASQDEPGQRRPGNGQPPTKVKEAADWLRARLAMGSVRVSYTRDAAQDAGIGTAILYRARDLLGLDEYEMDGRKWWRMPEADEDLPA
jgi:hypothetical protein